MRHVKAQPADEKRSKGRFIISRDKKLPQRKSRQAEGQPKTPTRNVQKSSGKKTRSVK